MIILSDIDLADFFPTGVGFFPDTDYACPTRSWLLGPFAKYYKEMCVALGTTKWTTKNDCDDFAALYRLLAHQCFFIDNKADTESIAVGEVWYYPDSGGGHAINFALIDEDTLIFIEPQTCEEVQLSKSEIKSIAYARA